LLSAQVCCCFWRCPKHKALAPADRASHAVRFCVAPLRTGVNELDVIKKDAAAFKAALRLTREQQDDKQALEDEIKFAKKELEEAGEDADKKKSSAAQLAAKQKELDEMVAGFEVRPAHTCAGRASPPRMRHPHALHTRRSRCSEWNPKT